MRRLAVSRSLAYHWALLAVPVQNPGRHGVQRDAPSPLNWPAAQGLAADCAGRSTNEPAGAGAHRAAWKPDAYEPSAHALQLLRARSDAKRPGNTTTQRSKRRFG